MDKKRIKSERKNITMLPDLWEAIDRWCVEHGASRSGFLQVAAKRYMQEETAAGMRRHIERMLGKGSEDE